MGTRVHMTATPVLTPGGKKVMIKPDTAKNAPTQAAQTKILRSFRSCRLRYAPAAPRTSAARPNHMRTCRAVNHFSPVERALPAQMR